MRYIDDDNTSPLSIGDFSSDIEGWINLFLDQKILDNVDKKTIRSYKNALASFKDFAKKNNNNTMKHIGVKFVNRYLIDYQASLAEKDKTLPDELRIKITRQRDEKFLGKNDAGFYIDERYQNTLNHRLTVLKMLLKYISENNQENHSYTDLFDGFVKIRIKEKFRDTLSVEEIDKLIDYMMEWKNIYKSEGHNYRSVEPDRIARRDSLLLLIYLLTGARGDEVVKIRLRDIGEFELEGEHYYNIKIQDGKGGKIREIPVHKDYIQGFVEYFKKELPNESYFISSLWNKDIGYYEKNVSADSMRKFANKIFKKNDINVSGLHAFRRGFATKKVAHEGVDIAVTAGIMGNSSNVLERFYLKIDSQAAVKKMIQQKNKD